METRSVRSFWDQQEHLGDPDTWSEHELRSWLQVRMGKAASELRQLDRRTMLQQVTAELDRLYSSYKPKFEYKFNLIDPESTLMWMPASRRPPGIAQLGVHVAGSFEGDFNSMFSLSEILANTRKTLPMGQSLEDDLRQNLILAAQQYDRGDSTILYQTHNQDQALTVSIRRSVLLLPQRKFKAADKVIVLKARPSSSSSSGNNSSCEVPAGSMGTVTEQQESDGSSSTALLLKGTEERVKVQTSQLLLTEAREPREREYVVLHSLQQKPELVGRLARVLQMPETTARAAASSNSDGKAATPKWNPDDRCRAVLVPWLVAESGTVTEKQEVVIAPRLSCIAAVQQPVAALLIAYASHNNNTPTATAAAMSFMSAQSKHLFPFSIVRTTQREQGMMLQYITKCGALLGRSSKTLERQLLGPLDPKHWTLGLMIPIKQPLSDAQQQRKTLKKALKCSYCGQQGSKEQPLRSCSGCKAVQYCSRDCQVADWKAHTPICKQGSTAAVSAMGAGSSSGGTGAASTSGSRCNSRDSVLFPLARPAAFKGQELACFIAGDSFFNSNELPKNIHGNKEFLVKLQYASTGGLLAAMSRGSTSSDAMQRFNPISVYDQARSFMVFIEPDQAGHAELLKILRAAGRPGRLNPASRVVYMDARREGPQLRVFVDELPEQQQPW